MANQRKEANDTFAANHVHFMSESQLNFIPREISEDEKRMIQTMADNRAIIEQHLLYQKMYSYREKNIVHIKLNKYLPDKLVRDEKCFYRYIIRLMTVAHDEIDCKVKYKDHEGDNLDIELLDGKLKLVELYYLYVQMVEFDTEEEAIEFDREQYNLYKLENMLMGEFGNN